MKVFKTHYRILKGNNFFINCQYGKNNRKIMKTLKGDNGHSGQEL